jgi:hypothetical protein
MFGNCDYFSLDCTLIPRVEPQIKEEEVLKALKEKEFRLDGLITHLGLDAERVVWSMIDEGKLKVLVNFNVEII